jgi:ComF family protein
VNSEKVYRPRRRWLPRWPCELCGEPAGQAGLCAGCHADLPWIGAACRLCARPLAAQEVCVQCLRQPPAWSRAIVPLAWSFPVAELIGRFKYGGVLHYGALLGRLLAAHCDGRQPDGVVPVPLHRARLAERGFNQALELARPVARCIGVPILDDVCSRTAETPPQAGLAAQQRYRNLRGAFAASPRVRGRRLAIIDDVMTTGSTAEALTLELLGAGASAVEVWAVARGGTAQSGAKV